MKGKKHLTAMLVVFAVVMVATAVYAAVGGALDIGISVTLAPNVRLEIVPYADFDILPNGSTGSMTVAPDGQTATITANLLEPGDEIFFAFGVENTGSGDAEITAVNLAQTVGPSNNAVVFTGSYQSASGIVPFGDEVGPFDIYIRWDPAVANADGDYEFTISLAYDAA